MRPSSSSVCLFNSQGAVIDDDYSESSTYDVVESAAKASDHNIGSPSHRVHFNLSENASYDNKQIFKEDCAEHWYRRSDFQAFKSSTIISARDVVFFDRDFSGGWESYRNVIERVYETCVESDMETTQVDEDDYDSFVRWVSIKKNRIGLERLVVRSLGKDKIARRRGIVATVLDIQRDFLQEKGLSKERQEEILSFACREISRPSRLFAMHLGKAQVFQDEIFQA
eukprot:CAMPEP_0198138464 /NCGR_PEP_ID=MMETSP1443-20131203/1877_1 /TAXON_ID=186043 /ORGANISM="Entomoneis sp., Strain CCMP2396" /LENGTH=225 /DNA_ID=CAMNT_0043800255 /DNA_START=56 /DNA_END=733 /DNA_ORIENTATION=+